MFGGQDVTQTRDAASAVSIQLQGVAFMCQWMDDVPASTPIMVQDVWVPRFTLEVTIAAINVVDLIDTSPIEWVLRAGLSPSLVLHWVDVIQPGKDMVETCLVVNVAPQHLNLGPDVIRYMRVCFLARFVGMF